MVPVGSRWSSESARAGTRRSSSPGNGLRVRQITHRHAVRVGGHHANRPVDPRHQHAGQERPAVVVRGGAHDLAHRFTQRCLGQLCRRLVGLAHRRELHDRVGVQLERRTGRTDGDVVPLVGKRHGSGLQPAHDVGREPRRNDTTSVVDPDDLPGHLDREVEVGPGHRQRIPVTRQQQAQQHRGGAAAASHGPARGGQHVDECIALGSELHRRLSFREFSQSFIVEGEVYEVGRGSKGCGLWMTWFRTLLAASDCCPHGGVGRARA